MRRNSITILKYLVVVVAVFLVAPLLLKNYLASDYSDAAKEAVRVVNPKLMIKKSLQLQQTENVDPPSQQRIDWHDYKLINTYKKRTGPGEQGSAVSLDAKEQREKDALYRVNGFNALVSDKISLHRALSDIRHPDCMHEKYSAHLPNVSIIIPFHDEHWSTLLRTVQSSLDQAPPHLIHEIILVDDYSTKDFLKKPLDEYVQKHYKNVRVLRAGKREGLIRTRLLGAKAATGDVLIFLDSHCEANVNWLPPLLDPIAADKRTVVCPFIDVIDYETFAYRAQDEGARGAFDWEFYYKRLPLRPEAKANPSKPFDSPVMAGGLFAISRWWFWELGGYDPGLDIWGGEQYELSFKIWQCGGRMVDAPCSRIGHIYRKFAPFPNPGIGDFISRNYKRVAEVWMDEYKNYLYKRRSNWQRANAGDLTAQFSIRKRLQCKPFDWFIKNVAFDLMEHYPAVEPPSYAEGELRNVGANLCVDTRFKAANERFTLQDCMSEHRGQGGEQRFELSWHKDIRPYKRNVCFDVSISRDRSPVVLFACHGMKGNQFWKYNLDTLQLYHPISGMCLDCDAGSREVFVRACETQTETQMWKFAKVNDTAVRDLWKAT